jgi:NAD(P)-dependent dehydrogenase (short-subunit alcohol dehydrogenase family)
VTDPTSGVVVVTGASSGIGRATALELARCGADLVLSARSASSLEVAAGECRALGAEVLTVVADVLDETDVERVLHAATARFGGVDGWVHTAAVVAYGRFEDVPSETFRRVVDTNVHGSVHAARAALRQFREQGHGTLVLTGSLLGEIATPFMSSYVTSKWAVRGLARVLAVEARDLPDVHVCIVSPGGVDTPVYLQAASYAGFVGRPPPPVDTPEKVARTVVRTLRDHRPRRGVGVANLVSRAGFTLLPSVFDLLVTPLMRAGGLSREQVAPHDGNVFEPRPDGDALHGRWGRHWLRAVAAAGTTAAFGTVAEARRRVASAGADST